MTVIALVLSWMVSVYFVPYLGTRFLKAPPHVQVQAGEQPGVHDMYDTPFYSVFQKTVNACIRHRWITIAATVALFGLGMVGMGRVQQQFFPDSSRPELMVDLWSAEGSSFAATEAVAKRVEARLMAEPG